MSDIELIWMVLGITIFAAAIFVAAVIGYYSPVDDIEG